MSVVSLSRLVCYFSQLSLWLFNIPMKEKELFFIWASICLGLRKVNLSYIIHQVIIKTMYKVNQSHLWINAMFHAFLSRSMNIIKFSFWKSGCRNRYFKRKIAQLFIKLKWKDHLKSPINDWMHVLKCSWRVREHVEITQMLFKNKIFKNYSLALSSLIQNGK